METHKSKTIIEAIEELNTFFVSDLYSKFKPFELVKGEIYKREDIFKDEDDFLTIYENKQNKDFIKVIYNYI